MNYHLMSQSYNIEIAKFIQEVNTKYSILFDFIVLEISRSSTLGRNIPSVCKIECSTRSQKSTQVPAPSSAEMPNFSVLPPPVNADLCHQQAEINKLM